MSLHPNRIFQIDFSYPKIPILDLQTSQGRSKLFLYEKYFNKTHFLAQKGSISISRHITLRFETCRFFFLGALAPLLININFKFFQVRESHHFLIEFFWDNFHLSIKIQIQLSPLVSWKSMECKRDSGSFWLWITHWKKSFAKFKHFALLRVSILKDS